MKKLILVLAFSMVALNCFADDESNNSSDEIALDGTPKCHCIQRVNGSTECSDTGKVVSPSNCYDPIVKE